MTANEVATTLFWIVAGSYVFYLGWTISQIAESRSSRRRHPTARAPRSGVRHRAGPTGRVTGGEP